MKRKLLLAALVATSALGMRAQTDVTSTYLTNASFELGTDGTPAMTTKGFNTPHAWTATNMPTSGTHNFDILSADATSTESASGFGTSVTPADGTYYYFGRHSWQSALTVTLSQDTKANLPAGKYLLDVAYKIAAKDNNVGGTVAIKAVQSSTELGSKTSPTDASQSTTYFNTAGWTRLAVPFTVSEAGTVTIQLVMSFNPKASVNTAQEAIILDDVKLYDLGAASAASSVNVTGLLTNASFELNTFTGTLDANSTADQGSLNYPTGWTFMLGTSGWNNCVNVTDAPSHGMYARETWAATINELQVYQNLTGLPKGVYEICADARTNDAGANDICTYGKVGEDIAYSAPWDQSKMNATWNGADNWQTLSSIFAVGDEGTAEVGLHSTHFMQFDNFTFKYYGDVTIAEVKLAAYVAAYQAALAEAQAFTESSMYADDWTALQTAITNNTLDLNDASLTENDLTTATANLEAANTAATAAVNVKTTYDTAVSIINGGTNVDLTSLIGNPSFESTAAYALVADGWVNEGVGIQGQTNSGFDGYRVGNVFAERWTGSGSIGAFKTYQTIRALPAGIYKVTAIATFNGDGVTLFANSTSAAIKDVNTYTVTVEIADKGSIELGVQGVSPTGSWFKADNFMLTYVGTADDLTYTLAEGKMGTDKSAAQIAAETAFNSDKTLANFNALLTAIAEAEASVANYTALKAAIDKAEALIEANNFVTADATSALEGEIATATAAWTNVTYTDAAATAEIAVLGSAVSGWHAIGSEGKAGAFMASAWGKSSENWWDAPYINTWSVEGDNDGTGFSVPFFEYHTGDQNNLEANTFTATLTGMENGRYEVEIWARVQRRTDADFNGDGSMITMSVNSGEAVSIMNSSNTVGTGGSQMRIDRYTATGDVTDGTLTLSINVKLGSNVHWLSWRDVKYTKLDEAEMVVKAGKYATFCAPFDVTIPEDVTASKVIGVNEDVLTLEEVTTTIPANTPVLLYSASAVDETFYGKAVDGDKTVGLLTGVYSGDSFPGNAYVLQTQDDVQAFYYYDGSDLTITPNRAYLKLPNEAKERVLFLEENEDATFISVISALTSGEVEAIYSVGGALLNGLQKGINIVKMRNGETKKVILK